METKEESELREEYERIIAQIIDVLKDEFQFSDSNRLNVNENLLQKFYILSSRGNSELMNIWEVSRGRESFYLCDVAYETTITIRGNYSNYSRTLKNHYFYGFLKPSKSFGRSLIRPETVQDKIADVFLDHEIDFKTHKNFSSKYFCESLDKEIFFESMSQELMDYLITLDYIELEFNDHGCLFRLEHSISKKEEAFKFIFIGSRLSQLIGV